MVAVAMAVAGVTAVTPEAAAVTPEAVMVAAVAVTDTVPKPPKIPTKPALANLWLVEFSHRGPLLYLWQPWND